ncbi:L-aspartate oxidase [Domibacillus iocasae]|uniref:L-aspartate oxidase n=1 Tax=Domibacillus iocasae TaxID=1714016 RepID=A0A1E7DMF2_9BACI|nr:L-aspartate oxidase [Domibacillus iocasae]OES44252.1 L-aspartate oxidase [Domibacillus iocasae]
MKKMPSAVIIGSGIAALQAARHLAAHMNVMVITKTVMRQSNSYFAQGGVAAVLSPLDTYESHINDTLAAGEFHHNAAAVKQLVMEGAACMDELLKEGFSADRQENGLLSLGLEGAHSHRRIVHAGGDATGKWAVEHFMSHLPGQVDIREHELAFELIVQDKVCTGVKTKSRNGKVHQYKADHVILATGGAGALYSFTSNQETITGDGIALAYRAGAAITDMEFVQFHPTLLYVNGETKGLISEAVRGAGAVLTDEEGGKIMQGVHPLGDLAPRHVTAFEIYKARKSGREVYLDISMIKEFERAFPTISAICCGQGIDIKKGLIPVAPGSHFLMGGVKTDTSGRTSIKGLYAIGETACTGVHGANRLASNSLLEGIAFGKRFAKALIASGEASEKAGQPVSSAAAAIPPLFEKKELQSMMMESAGIIRTSEKLQALADCLRGPVQTKGDISHWPVEKIESLFMHTTAYLIAVSALVRTESRGAHIRADHPLKQAQWEKTWITFENGQLNKRSGEYEWNQAGRSVESLFY